MCFCGFGQHWVYHCFHYSSTNGQRLETGNRRDRAGDSQVRVCCKQAHSVSQPSLNKVPASKTVRHTFTTGLRRTTERHADGQRSGKAVSSHWPHPHVTFERPFMQSLTAYTSQSVLGCEATSGHLKTPPDHWQADDTIKLEALPQYQHVQFVSKKPLANRPIVQNCSAKQVFGSIKHYNYTFLQLKQHIPNPFPFCTGRPLMSPTYARILDLEAA